MLSGITKFGAIDGITGILTGLISLIEKLTDSLGVLNLPLVAKGIHSIIKATKGGKSSGGRVKITYKSNKCLPSNNMPPNRLAERCASPGVY